MEVLGFPWPHISTPTVPASSGCSVRGQVSLPHALEQIPGLVKVRNSHGGWRRLDAKFPFLAATNPLPHFPWPRGGSGHGSCTERRGTPWGGKCSLPPPNPAPSPHSAPLPPAAPAPCQPVTGAREGGRLRGSGRRAQVGGSRGAQPVLVVALGAESGGRGGGRGQPRRDRPGGPGAGARAGGLRSPRDTRGSWGAGSIPGARLDRRVQRHWRSAEPITASG